MKLDKKHAKATSEAESANRELADEGVYVAELIKVEAKVGKDSKQPYWLWTFEIPKDAEDYPGKRFFVNTSLQENAAWKLKEVFDAFGETPDTDTDELIGEEVRLVVVQRPIGSGPRMGEPSNQVENVLPLTGEDDESGGDGGDGPPF